MGKKPREMGDQLGDKREQNGMTQSLDGRQDGADTASHTMAETKLLEQKHPPENFPLSFHTMSMSDKNIGFCLNTDHCTGSFKEVMQWGGRIRQETNVDILSEARHYLDLVPNHGGKPSCQANLELQERGELPGPYRDPTQSSQESEPRGRISRTASDNASSGSPCRNSIRPNFNSDILPLDMLLLDPS